jgi:hypothetical protein
MFRSALYRVLNAVGGYDPAVALLTSVIIAAVCASTYCALGHLHYQRLASNERIAAERAERANADLQDALYRMRDDLAATQARINALEEELAAAQARTTTGDELERQLAAYEQAVGRRAAAAQRTPASRLARRSTMALARALPPAPEQPSRVMVSAPAALAPGQFKNFTSPGWVPSYFDSESAPFLGSTNH